MSRSVRDLERRLRVLERELERGVRHASGSAIGSASDVGQMVASVLNKLAERVRSGAEAFGGEAGRIREEATRIGTQGLRRLASEVEYRPLLTLAVAVGVGVLIGLSSRRR